MNQYAADTHGFDIMLGEGIPRADSPPNDVRYDCTMRSIADNNRVYRTPAGGVRATKWLMDSANGATFVADGRVILVRLVCGLLEHYVAVGEKVPQEECPAP